MVNPLPNAVLDDYPLHTREIAGSIPAAPITNLLQMADVCLQIRRDN